MIYIIEVKNWQIFLLPILKIEEEI